VFGSRIEDIHHIFQIHNNHNFDQHRRMKSFLFCLVLLLSLNLLEAKEGKQDKGVRGGNGMNTQPASIPAVLPSLSPFPAPSPVPSPAPTSGTVPETASVIHCGCQTCTDEFWNANAEGESCGARILWVQNTYPEAYPNEQAACALVASLEFPSVCGPACDPGRCSESTLSTPTTSQPTPVPTSVSTPLPTHVPTSTPMNAIVTTTHCGCETCTDDIWNAVAEGYTCGARILWLQSTYPQSYPTEQAACALVAGAEFPSICGPACNPRLCSPSSIPPPVATPVPTTKIVQVTSLSPVPSPTTKTTSSKPTSSSYSSQETYCGCQACTAEVWNKDADGHTCGERISYLLLTNPGAYPTERDACARVAGVEFRIPCGPACDPARCDKSLAPITPAPTPANTSPLLSPSHELYCYPTFAKRKRYTNVWSKYTVEVKEGGDSLCGPGDNRFSNNTVAVNDDTLTMSFQKVGSNWEASEVRVLLPDSEMPFQYGKFSFSIKSVTVLDTTDGSIVSRVLPDNLVLGLFTWDDTERYDIHENWNHEVDIEISRWGDPNKSDVQFLVQPPGAPQLRRFFSGTGTGSTSLNPGGHIYEFAWNPGKIDWYSTAGGGQSHTYDTKTSILNGYEDFIQCLPANIEIRINLWNSNGATAPSGLSDRHKVEVAIDKFTYTPSGLSAVPNGGYCSKHCMCSTNARCVNGICASTR
jgi:Glycosyl hydrolases family 16